MSDIFEDDIIIDDQTIIHTEWGDIPKNKLDDIDTFIAYIEKLMTENE